MISRTFITFILALALSVPLSALAANEQGMERVDDSQFRQANAAAANETSSAVTADTNNSGSNASSTGGFVSLTQLPAISDAADTNSLPQFLNTLYKICIGVGAVLAVLMIMFAGFLFMTSRGSVSSNEKAKSYIQNAVLGLILLLSPTIVFGIINPDILNLDLNFDELKLRDLTPIDFSSNESDPNGCSSIKKTKLVDIKRDNKGNLEPGTTCSAIGKGWGYYPNCGSAPEGKVFCGYDPKNDQSTPTVPGPETENGNYTFDWYLRQEDFSTEDNGFCLLTHTQRYETQQACTSALSSFKASTKDPYAVSDNCNGSVGQITPKNTYDQIIGLHACQE